MRISDMESGEECVVEAFERRQNAEWIWNPEWDTEDDVCPRVVLFRKRIWIESEPSQGSIQICADTRYKLYINGQLAEVGPCKGNGRKWYYDTIDLLPYLKKGENLFGVSVLRYPQEPEMGSHSLFRTSMPGLYIRGSIQDRAGSVYTLSTDSSWKCYTDKKRKLYREEERFAPLIIHEHTLGDPKLIGWQSLSYDDSFWVQARPYDPGQVPMALRPESLRSRAIPFLYRNPRCFCSVVRLIRSSVPRADWMSFLKREKDLVIPPGTQVIAEMDAGEEVTGYIRASFAGGRDAVVSLLYSESYVQDEFAGPEKIPVKDDRTDIRNGHLSGYEDTYQVAGTATGERYEVYEPYWFRTFRFVRVNIQTAGEALTFHCLDYEETGYPLDVGTSVKTSDPTLDGIWEISERTLRRCMHETYEDCPFYEQMQYIMDARQEILYTYAVSADDRLARQCLDSLRYAQREDGLLNCSYPDCTVNVIPGFSIYYILMVYDHMMYFGDPELTESHMPIIDGILDFFEHHLTDTGLVDKIGGTSMADGAWSFIDWADAWADTNGMPTAGLQGPLTMETFLYIYGLEYAARLADYLDRTEKAENYRMRAQTARRAVQKHCIGADGLVQDGPGIEAYSQHCQVFAVLTDTLNPGSGRENLLRAITNPGFTPCSVAMQFYLFRALEKTGLYAYTDQCWNIWRQMLRLHCTTCVESQSYARSECHAWGSLILYELPSVTLGVRPASPGYKKIRISPMPGYLTGASGTVMTPAGAVHVSWKMESGAIKVEYKVPEGVKVEYIESY